MNSLTREGKFIVSGGLALIIVVSIGIYWWQRGDSLLVQPPPQITQERMQLYENCARTEFPRSDDTLFDPEKRIIAIYYWDEKLQDNAKLELPFEPETGFAGCSESAKSIIWHIQETVVFP